MIASAIVFSSCEKKAEPVETIVITDPPASNEQPTESLLERGKKVFQKNCQSCHTSNPTVGGPMCPPNAFSSEELLRLKVLEGKYPNGYKPKKATRMMPKFPQLKDEIEALHEYLNSFPRK